MSSEKVLKITVDRELACVQAKKDRAGGERLTQAHLYHNNLPVHIILSFIFQTRIIFFLCCWIYFRYYDTHTKKKTNFC
jgi:hypothetical protein